MLLVGFYVKENSPPKLYHKTFFTLIFDLTKDVTSKSAKSCEQPPQTVTVSQNKNKFSQSLSKQKSLSTRHSDLNLEKMNNHFGFKLTPVSTCGHRFPKSGKKKINQMFKHWNYFYSFLFKLQFLRSLTYWNAPSFSVML